MAKEKISLPLRKPSPLFVLGCPRSGTSLTRNLLRQLDGVYLAPDEFQVLPAFAALYRGDDHSPRRIAKFLEDTAFAEHMRRRGLWPERQKIESRLGHRCACDFRSIVLSIAESEGLTRLHYWGDKTPENVFHLALIAQLWPEARILNVLRDPRATVASMHRAWGRSVLRSAVIWRDAQRAVEQAESLFRYRNVETLRYEDLVADPISELSRLADWLDVDFDPDVLEKFSNEERWGAAAGRTGIIAPPPDNWRDALSAKQVKLIEEISLCEMNLTGYRPTLAARQRSPRQLELRFAQLGDSVRVLRAYSRERGLRNALHYKIRQWRGARRA